MLSSNAAMLATVTDFMRFSPDDINEMLTAFDAAGTRRSTDEGARTVKRTQVDGEKQDGTVESERIPIGVARVQSPKNVGQNSARNSVVRKRPRLSS